MNRLLKGWMSQSDRMAEVTSRSKGKAAGCLFNRETGCFFLAGLLLFLMWFLKCSQWCVAALCTSYHFIYMNNIRFYKMGYFKPHLFLYFFSSIELRPFLIVAAHCNNMFLSYFIPRLLGEKNLVFLEFIQIKKILCCILKPSGLEILFKMPD